MLKADSRWAFHGTFSEDYTNGPGAYIILKYSNIKNNAEYITKGPLDTVSEFNQS